ncbi:hypothetical protein F8161_14310 [Bacillus cereus]|nr:hypothetical protein F8161_14310 [Bacillus cereus]
MARSESLDIGTPDREALFASSEGVKWPTDSSHCSWIPLKAKVARSQATNKKRKSPAFHQSEATLFLLTLFLFLLESWYVFEKSFFLLAVTIFFPWLTTGRRCCC